MTLISRGALHKCQFTSLKGVATSSGATGPTYATATPIPEDYFYVAGLSLTNNFDPIRVYTGKFDYMHYQYRGSVLSCQGVLLKDSDFFKALLYQDYMTVSGTTKFVFQGVRPQSLSLQGGPNRLLTGHIAWQIESVGEYPATTVPNLPSAISSPLMSFTGPASTLGSCLRCDIDNTAQVRSLEITINYQTQYIGMIQQPISPAREGSLTITMVKGTYPDGPTGAATSPATTTTADVTAFSDLSGYGNRDINFTSPSSSGVKVHFIGCIAQSRQVQISEPIGNAFYIVKTETYSFKNFEVIGNSGVQTLYHGTSGWEFQRSTS